MKRIKIAQIGIEHDHARKIMTAMRSLPEIFEVVGWCDPEKIVEFDPFTGKQVIAGVEYKGDTNIYRHLYDGVPEMELEELLNYPGLEAVVIESSELNLFKYAQMAAERGLHVHMDKPGGLSCTDFEKLADTMKRTGKVLHLGYMYRYNPEIQRMFSDIEAGRYGEIYSVECHMSCRHPDEKRAWMSKFPGGMMFFLGCHLVDIIYRIQGEPEEVIPLNCVTGTEGLQEGEDFGFAVFRYKNGVSFAKASAAEPGGFKRRQIVVCGTKGTLEIRPIEDYPKLDDPDNPHPSDAYLVTDVRDVTEDLLSWQADGVRRQSSFFRYGAMMEGFAEIVRGEKINPYTMEYELALYRILMKACGVQ